jgi:serine/threonine-protein kinase RsbW
MVSEKPVNQTILIESRPQAIAEILQQIIIQVKANGYGDDDIFAIQLAMEEALINAIKHGNNGDESKKVKIEYAVSEEKVEIFITDEGKGFNSDALPDPRYGNNLYKTCGRGVLLIRSYMDVAEYNKLGNKIHMVRYRRSESR